LDDLGLDSLDQLPLLEPSTSTSEAFDSLVEGKSPGLQEPGQELSRGETGNELDADTPELNWSGDVPPVVNGQDTSLIGK
jgi:hypothetical protein